MDRYINTVIYRLPKKKTMYVASKLFSRQCCGPFKSSADVLRRSARLLCVSSVTSDTQIRVLWGD